MPTGGPCPRCFSIGCICNPWAGGIGPSPSSVWIGMTKPTFAPVALPLSEDDVGRIADAVIERARSRFDAAFRKRVAIMSALLAGIPDDDTPTPSGVDDEERSG